MFAQEEGLLLAQEEDLFLAQEEGLLLAQEEDLLAQEEEATWCRLRDSIASNKRRHGAGSGIRLHQTKGDMVPAQRFDCIKQKATWC
jgi:hypothetical protein